MNIDSTITEVDIDKFEDELNDLKEINNEIITSVKEINDYDELSIINYENELNYIQNDIYIIRDLLFYFEEVVDNYVTDLEVLDFESSEILTDKNFQELIPYTEENSKNKQIIILSSVIGGILGGGIGFLFGAVPSIAGGLIGSGTSYYTVYKLKN